VRIVDPKRYFIARLLVTVGKHLMAFAEVAGRQRLYSHQSDRAWHTRQQIGSDHRKLHDRHHIGSPVGKTDRVEHVLVGIWIEWIHELQIHSDVVEVERVEQAVDDVEKERIL